MTVVFSATYRWTGACSATQTVTRHSLCVLLAIACSVMIASRADAQTQSQPAQPQTQTAGQPPDQPPAAGTTSSDQDDDAALRPLDPDFTVVNLPTTLPLPKGAGNFHLTHRFVGVNWRQDDASTIASNLFGFDGPAVIQLEYRIAVMKHLEAVVARTNFGRTVQFSLKYDAIHQSASRPLGVSGILAIEGQNNFRPHNVSGADIGYAPAIGLALSRTLGTAASVYLDPILAANTLPTGVGDKRNTFYVGIGARVKIVPAFFLVGEVSPRVAGYKQGDPEFAVSLEKRVGGHVFSLVVANTEGTTYGQLARGGNPQTLYIGFNLARKFY
jgi:Membrane bound beta barrel domain (DUF5777)